MASDRKRLGLSADDFGLQVGTVRQSDYGWASGKSKLRAMNLAAIAALRGVGKREVAKRLDALKRAAREAYPAWHEQSPMSTIRTRSFDSVAVAQLGPSELVVRGAVNYRRIQAEFLSRGKRFWQEYQRTGQSHPAGRTSTGFSSESKRGARNFGAPQRALKLENARTRAAKLGRRWVKSGGKAGRPG